MGFLSDFFTPTALSSEESESVSEQIGRSASTSRPADFTSAQLALQQLASQQGSLQLQNLLNAMGSSQALQTPSTLQMSGLTQAQQATEQSTQQQELLDQLFRNELTRIQEGAAPTAQQQALIGRIANERIAAGQSDIQAALQESLGLLRSELAPSRGFRPEDTPIQDRGQVLARESLRLTEDLISQARQQEAQQLLDYPLQASALRSQQAQSLQNTGLQREAQSLQLQQFQDMLKNQAFARQLNLAQLAPTNIGQFTPPGTISSSLSEDVGKSVSVGSATRRGQGPGASLLGSFLGEFIGGLGSLIGNQQQQPQEDGEPPLSPTPPINPTGGGGGGGTGGGGGGGTGGGGTGGGGTVFDPSNPNFWQELFGLGDDESGGEWSIGGFLGDLFGGFGGGF